MDFVLWLMAVAMVIGGIVMVARREVVLGVLLIVLGLLVGPGGVSLLS
jgi:hypothetical protein